MTEPRAKAATTRRRWIEEEEGGGDLVCGTREDHPDQVAAAVDRRVVRARS